MHFRDLTEPQLLALAISLEEEDGRIYDDFSAALRADYPATADLFKRMSAEESQHRHELIDAFQKRYGDHIPMLRRHDVKGFSPHRAAWRFGPLKPEKARREAALMELETRRFYEAAIEKTSDAGMRQLLGDLARAEQEHGEIVSSGEAELVRTGTAREEHDTAQRQFILSIVQPGLVGLMDGSVSTLAPVFAAAFATGNTADTFRVGFAASVGAGISMGFAEALADDGKLSGRGTPWLRGVVCGLMTTVGGIGHTLPYLLPEFRTATVVAVAVVIVELAVICWIRHRYMETPVASAALQIGFGGALVFVAGVLIGKS
jgi:erythrin-vacuolar iron transport family protein